jgi:hypothetical protein
MAAMITQLRRFRGSLRSHLNQRDASSVVADVT